uniref:Uncharacterized protein n=1 Tax=Anguilla anguilla TaxID=7936 RepID=A0A0E9VWU5_ANGAN
MVKSTLHHSKCSCLHICLGYVLGLMLHGSLGTCSQLSGTPF